MDFSFFPLGKKTNAFGPNKLRQAGLLSQVSMWNADLKDAPNMTSQVDMPEAGLMLNDLMMMMMMMI